MLHGAFPILLLLLSGPPRTPAPKAPSTEELAAIRESVKNRCGVAADAQESSLPWYYHYVMGTELLSHGDYAGAVPYLESAIKRKTLPKKSSNHP